MHQFYLNNFCINLNEINFKTTESSEIYFRNLRAYFYDKEERQDANYLLYRINSREIDSTKNKLNFVLVNNWLIDESYIIAEGLNKEGLISCKADNADVKIQLAAADNEANYIFAAQLFETLSKKIPIYLINGTDTIAFTQAEQVSLKTTLKDYFKLVGKVR